MQGPADSNRREATAGRTQQDNRHQGTGSHARAQPQEGRQTNVQSPG